MDTARYQAQNGFPGVLSGSDGVIMRLAQFGIHFIIVDKQIHVPVESQGGAGGQLDVPAGDGGFHQGVPVGICISLNSYVDGADKRSHIELREINDSILYGVQRVFELLLCSHG